MASLIPGDNCWHFTKENPFVIKAGFGIGALLGAIFWLYCSIVAPIYPVLKQDPMIWRDRFGTVWFEARYVSVYQGKCFRVSELMFYRSMPDGRRLYYSSAAGIGGSGLMGSVYDYDILRSFPPGFPEGEWNFILRLHYTCGYWPFSWPWDNTAGPIAVIIPPLPEGM